MNRSARRASKRNRGMLVTASLAAGSLFGYVGYTRPAFASGTLSTCTVTSNSANPNDTDSGTLAYCIDNLVSDGSGVIDFDGVDEIDMGTNAPFVIDKSLTIQGTSSSDGTVSPVFDGNDRSGIFTSTNSTTLVAGDTVKLKDLTLKNGSADYGGAIYMEYDAQGANLIIEGVVFEKNYATKRGGAVYSYAYVDVSKSTFKENDADTLGGAIYAGDGLKVSTSLFERNEAVGGGAINTMNSSFKLYSSTFRNNIASGEGGVGISYAGGAAIVRDSLFEGNKAYGSYGGALYTAGIDVSGGSFIGNYTAGRGGSIYSWTSIDIKESVFFENEADKGGAIFAPRFGNDVNVSNSTFYKNSANQWGAIGGDTDSDLEIDFSTFYKNYSLDSQEAVFSDTVTVDNSIIAGGSSVAEDVMSNEPEFAVDDDRYVNFSLFSDAGDLMLQAVVVDGVFSHLSPSSGSPAIGGANPASDVATDQLGNERTSPSTIGAVEYVAVSSSPPSFSAPVPTTSPILTVEENKPFSQGETVVARVSNATRVESVSIGDSEAEIVSFEDGLLSFTVPELEAGSYSITGEFNSGTVIFDVGIAITGQTVSGSEELNVWTKKVSDTEAKVYAKNPIGNGKIQFFVDGEEIAWVRAEDSDDPKLIEAQGNYYLVRTVELTDSKQAIEIFVDGVRAWRAAYTATS